MAKKNLQSLMSGIIGTEPTQQDFPANPPQDNEKVAQEIKPEIPRATRGRPRRADSEEKVRTTFVLSADLPRKLRYISLMEDILQQDIVAQALNDYIAKWEAENGKIKMPKK